MGTTSEYDSSIDTWLIGLTRRTEEIKRQYFPKAGTFNQTELYSYYNTSGAQKSSVSIRNSSMQLKTIQQHDVFGNVIQQSKSGTSLQNSSRVARFDTRGQFVIQKTNELGHSEYFQFDSRFGHIEKHTDANGRLTMQSPDPLGRILSSTLPDGSNSSKEYSLCNSSCPTWAVFRVTYCNPCGVNHSIFLDALHRPVAWLTRSVNGSNVWHKRSFDQSGLIFQTTAAHYEEARLDVSTFEYDNLRRPIQQCRSIHPFPCSQRSYDGLTTTYTDYMGRTTKKRRDALGRLVASTDASGNVTHYMYDAAGFAIEVIDAANHSIRYRRDANGKVAELNDPNLGSWSSLYDAEGRLLQRQDPMHRVTKVQYDGIGRKTSLQSTLSQDNFEFEYDSQPHGVGKLASVRRGEVTQLFSYDRLSRKNTTSIRLGSEHYLTSWHYDSCSRLASTTDAGGLTVSANYQNGVLSKLLRSFSANTVQLWQVDDVDAQGHVLMATSDGVQIKSELEQLHSQ